MSSKVEQCIADWLTCIVFITKQKRVGYIEKYSACVI